MSLLFSPLTLRGLTLRNRTVVSPMCQYSAVHGRANDWHLVQLGRFAVGGFGLVVAEATGVTAEGRISYGDLGLWDDAQIGPLARITRFVKGQGAAAGIQLAHAGRKAATPIAWRSGFDETEAEKAAVGFEHWLPVAPSAIAHTDRNPDFQVPHALTRVEIEATVAAFAAAADRADRAGFDVVEIHGAHGYLVNQFLSPLSNRRTDDYGGSTENRMRFALEVAAAVRETWPEHKPLFMRLSVTDGSPDGWGIEDSVTLARRLMEIGVDAIDCSSGGFDGHAIKAAPLYQVPLARAVRAAGLPTVAVGLVQTPEEAESILADGSADMVALARGALDDPNWPLHAHHVLDGGGEEVYGLWPPQARNRIRDRDRVLGRRHGPAAD
jgi:2,4-dienoyl-CoA reductase-like NADH-dependent reductase (Old Yellow Enzyme family)